MIKKIIAIRNVGRFASCAASGDVTFRKLTLIYAENGRGKTTLTDILRSMGTGNGAYILGRKTLGNNDPSSATILVDGDKVVTFKDGVWDGTGPRLAIYDSTFVHENVYSGDHIDHEHKRNLYRVIVGEEGVSLARKVDEYDAAIRDANKDVGAKASTIRAVLPSGLKLETFVALKQDTEVAKALEAKQLEIVALERAKEIGGKAALAIVGLLQLPTNFEELLTKVLEDISKEAEEKVKQHVGTHAKPGGEEWISHGLALSKGEQCPFCGESIREVELVSAYKEYFGQSYTAFRKELADLEKTVEQSFGETALLGLQRTITDNTSLGDFWRQFVTINLPGISFHEIETVVKDLRKTAINRLKIKLASPLDPVSPDTEFTCALGEYQKINELAAAYSKEVATANLSIAAKKKSAETGSLAKAKTELAELQAVKKRHEIEVDKVCREYEAATLAKAALDKEKAKAKEKLDGYSNLVFAKYERRINDLLEIFGAGFRIGETKTSYIGGAVSSSFHIVINNVAVELGDEATPSERASFKNTLSAGDRSTLAFAFFVAQLESNSKLADTVIIFDDPFTSQDRSRRMQTKQQVCKLADSARQVVTMSHDPAFLKQIKDSMPSGDVRTLQFLRYGEKNSTIGDCDIDEVVRGDYFDNYNILHKYLYYGDGKPRHAVRSIRPLLEAYLRVKLPREFKSNEWLGNMIDKIRDSEEGSPLLDAKAILGNLESINEYSKRYHHDEGAEDVAEVIDDGELQTFIRLTFSVVGGF